jgi:hypothetical protein
VRRNKRSIQAAAVRYGTLSETKSVNYFYCVLGFHFRINIPNGQYLGKWSTIEIIGKCDFLSCEFGQETVLNKNLSDRIYNIIDKGWKK